jgi:hypothetical protein
MRTHQQIINDAGGPAAVARAVNADPGTAKQWRRLNSIPATYWAEVARQKIATLDELAAGAEARRNAATPSEAAA